MIIKRTKYFCKWYDKLHLNIQNKIDSDIDKVSKGNFANCKSVGEGVHEIKIDYQKGYRVYFTNKNGEIIILLLGGNKSTQQEDIENAKKLKKVLEV